MKIVFIILSGDIEHLFTYYLFDFNLHIMPTRGLLGTASKISEFKYHLLFPAVSSH